MNRKKLGIAILLAGITLLLASCSKKEKTTLTVLVPGGTPALSQMYIENKNTEYGYRTDTVQGSDALSAAFLSESYDFIYAPLNLGMKMYLNNGNYQLLSTVVECNYYFVLKTENEVSMEEVRKKNITIFGENAMSGILARYVLGNTDGLSITYVSSVQDALSAFIVDDSTAVLLSEPQLSTLESKKSGIKWISVKEEYLKKESSSENIPQAAVFVKKGLDKKAVLKYMERLQESVKTVNSDTDASALLGSTLYPSFQKDVLAKALPRAEIRYKSASEAETMVRKFEEFLNGYNEKILGGTVDDGFFYKEG